MRSLFYSFANRTAALLMKLLFGCVARVWVLRRENANHAGGFLLAANHISHFDPFIISSVVRRKIDWMTMARSEERRVGKEWRWRWARYHQGEENGGGRVRLEAGAQRAAL